jgi:hypothetical protein
MEYTFRNSFAQAACSVHLNEGSIKCESAGEEITIPYSQFVEVRLMHVGDNSYKTVIIGPEKKTITITNRFYTADKVFEDQSRNYATFIRVLHFHLKDKSKAHFFTGKYFTNIWLWLATTVLISFVISYITHYFSLGLANPIIQGAVLAVLIGFLIVALNFSSRGRHYEPTDIPLEFLPEIF